MGQTRCTQKNAKVYSTELDAKLALAATGSNSMFCKRCAEHGGYHLVPVATHPIR